MTPEMIEIAISTFITLFVVIDPIGIAPLFGVLTHGMSSSQRTKIAIKGMFVGGVVLFLFAIMGDSILSTLGISMPAFKAAGGLLLLLIAIEMIFEKRTRRREKRTDKVEAEMEEDKEDDDISVFPIGIPFVAGPGSIATVMLLMSHHQDSDIEQAVVLASLGVTLLVSLLLFLGGVFVLQKLGNSIATAMTRIMGIILAALAVQYVFDGIKATFLI
jgi:multiple antibiotic resistance protein